MKDKCNTPYCRGEVVVKYLGKLLCQKCYDQVCREEDINELQNDIIEEIGGL